MRRGDERRSPPLPCADALGCRLISRQFGIKPFVRGLCDGMGYQRASPSPSPLVARVPAIVKRVYVTIPHAPPLHTKNMPCCWLPIFLDYLGGFVSRPRVRGCLCFCFFGYQGRSENARILRLFFLELVCVLRHHANASYI
jgi:hypothetical protein